MDPEVKEGYDEASNLIEEYGEIKDEESFNKFMDSIRLDETKLTIMREYFLLQLFVMEEKEDVIENLKSVNKMFYMLNGVNINKPTIIKKGENDTRNLHNSPSSEFIKGCVRDGLGRDF